MKLRLLATSLALFSFAAVTACATSAPTGIPDTTPGTNTPPGTATPAAEEEEDVTKQPPHSLGVIVLGESHTAGTSKSVPIVNASFLPDALLTKSCKKTLSEGCEIQEVPKCSKVSGSTTGCNSDEACTFDDNCKAVCKRYAVCETACEEDEVCKLPSSGSSSTDGTCVKRESFDAGPLAFSGTTTSITLFPPYAYETTGQGAPFLAGAEIKVQAQGATEAGFEKFDEAFTATTFLQTSPALNKISREKIFGTGSIPIAWAAGTDTILVSVTGPGGTATCKVKDSLGKFDIPRSVVKAAQTVPSATSPSTESLSITVARQKREVRKEHKAKGTLQLVSVKPEAWVELITRSTETASFQGCGSGQTFCDDKCADLDYDRENCGSCGNVCSSSQSCYNGTCSGGSSSGSTGTCSSCRANAQNGSCYSYYSTCSADTSCYNISYCAQSCTTSSCVYNCEQSYPAGQAKYSGLKSCLSSYCSSTCGF